MTTLKLLSAGLIIATAFASPAMARESSANGRRTAVDAYAAVDRAPAASKRGCVRAPDVGAFTLPGVGLPASPPPVIELARLDEVPLAQHNYWCDPEEGRLAVSGSSVMRKEGRKEE